jgi:hypothetical protein
MDLDVPRTNDTDMLVLLPLPCLWLRPLLHPGQLGPNSTVTLDIFRRYIGHDMRWGRRLPQL